MALDPNNYLTWGSGTGSGSEAGPVPVSQFPLGPGITDLIFVGNPEIGQNSTISVFQSPIQQIQSVQIEPGNYQVTVTISLFRYNNFPTPSTGKLNFTSEGFPSESLVPDAVLTSYQVPDYDATVYNYTLNGDVVVSQTGNYFVTTTTPGVFVGSVGSFSIQAHES